MIQYNVTVKASLYAKYYFELRSLFKDSEWEFPLQGLSSGDFERLESRSSKYEEVFKAAIEKKKWLNKTVADIKYSS